jgi:hypothetical protein
MVHAKHVAQAVSFVDLAVPYKTQAVGTWLLSVLRDSLSPRISTP